MDENTKKIKFLVADTTAFINAVQLSDYAHSVLTVPDVMAEVRNKRQIRRLCVLPFDLEVREPRPESVRKCVEFSKKTGDYASLSGIDIKVIALTYELEADNVGTEHLRTEPVVSKIVASKEMPEEFRDSTKLAGWYNPHGAESDDDVTEIEHNIDAGDIEEIQQKETLESEGRAEIDDVKEMIDKQMAGAEDNKSSGCEMKEVTQSELDKMLENLKFECTEVDNLCDILVPADLADQSNSDTCEEDFESNNNNPLEVLHAATDDDCGWITPANIKKIKKSLEGKVEDDIVPLVACMSTDFALQNVLKQMNLHVSALNGRIIKHLRTYILRCYACFKTTSIMTKVFCPSCGNKTLKRVAVSLDENGKQVIHINTRRPLTTKFKNQSIPRFRGGKHSRNPILFEDQPIPRQMPSRIAKTKTNALEDDYIAGFSPFAMRDVDSKSAMLRSKGNIKEWARNNTFEEDRRRKHYNRLYK